MTRAIVEKNRESANPIPWEERRPQVTEELLAGIVARVVETFNPDKIVLFGSYAYGTPHVYSDVDLLVVMDSTQRVFDRMRQVRKAAKVPSLPMDILVFTPAEMKARLDMGDHFYREVLSKGRVLYERAGR